MQHRMLSHENLILNQLYELFEDQFELYNLLDYCDSEVDLIAIGKKDMKIIRIIFDFFS
jgi:hypothetical protein